MVSRVIARTGLKVRPYDGFSAHGLRAGGASDLLEACGGDLRVAMEFLGHANLATTSIYTRRAHRQKMRDALELRRWTTHDDEAA
jgi:integrase